MRYMLNISNRKDLVKRLEQLTGAKGIYTRLPRLAYDFEGMSVDKNGNLEVENPSAKIAILKTLLSEGLISGSLPDEETMNEQSESGFDTEIEMEAESDVDSEAEPDNEIETNIEADIHPGLNDDGENAPDNEGAEEEEITPEEAIDNPGLIKPNIGFPLEGHTGKSIQNLLSLLYSRGSLISKSTGGIFFVSEELLDRVRSSLNYLNVENMVEMLPEDGGPDLKGVVIDEKRLIFTGFPATDDEDEIQAFIQLATMMNRQVIEQNRIHIKKADATNEKYTFRSWLIQIGMKGNEFKETRSILLKRLSGHTAFRTPAEAARWKSRHRQESEKQKEAQLLRTD